MSFLFVSRISRKRRSNISKTYKLHLWAIGFSIQIDNRSLQVASLAAVSLICFSSSAILALVTNVPVSSYIHSSWCKSMIMLFLFQQPSNFLYLLLQVLLYWYSTDADIIYNAIILFVYYFIGIFVFLYSQKQANNTSFVCDLVLNVVRVGIAIHDQKW